MMNEEQFEQEQLDRDNTYKQDLTRVEAERDKVRAVLERVESERMNMQEQGGQLAVRWALAVNENKTTQAQLAAARELMRETERVLRIGDGYGWEDRLANSLAAFLAQGAQAGDERDQFHQLAFEVGEPDEDGDGYHFSAEQLDEFVAKLNRAALATQPAAGEPLTVWYGSMPESNGKTNWTAILHRKGHGLMDGPHLTIARSEYPNRVRYEADQVRHIIGELAEEPDILAYDADAHSGYTAPPAAAHGDEVVRKDEPTQDNEDGQA